MPNSQLYYSAQVSPCFNKQRQIHHHETPLSSDQTQQHDRLNRSIRMTRLISTFILVLTICTVTQSSLALKLDFGTRGKVEIANQLINPKKLSPFHNLSPDAYLDPVSGKIFKTLALTFSDSYPNLHLSYPNIARVHKISTFHS